MLNSYDPVDEARRHITGRIGELASALPKCAMTQIVQHVDDIRCLARDHGFAAVETLASQLESSVAAGGYRAAILTYLDAMSDAAADLPGPLPASAREAWLASVALRLGN